MKSLKYGVPKSSLGMGRSRSGACGALLKSTETGAWSERSRWKMVSTICFAVPGHSIESSPTQGETRRSDL
eukprot:2631561-Pyramimonas_sp.AAC.1